MVSGSAASRLVWSGNGVMGERGNVTALRSEWSVGVRGAAGARLDVDQPASLLATRDGFLWGRS